jgi:regulator of sigma E protease
MPQIIWFILLLGVLVTVHELGHFLVAKACGVKVLKFSFGFGPKLLGFTKGETEYQIALLPLGGFVKMAGDVPGEELAPEEAHRGFLAQPPWKRMAIVIAGPAFNLLFPILIYFFVYLGPHEVTAARVGNVLPGSPAAVAGLQPGDKILAVDGEKVRTFNELSDSMVGRFERPVPITIERNGTQSIVTATPLKKVESNPIETVERGILGIDPYPPAALVGVPPGSVAEQAGLRTFDRILAVNGTLVPDEGSLQKELAKHEGTLELTVQRTQPVEAGAAVAHLPEVLKLSVQKQAGQQGLAALGAEPVDLYIGGVTPGSPADKSGLRAGDRLVALNGKPLASFTLLSVELSGLKDKPLELTWRGKEGERTATLEHAPMKTVDEIGQESSPLELGLRPWIAERGPAERITIELGVGEALSQSARVVPKIIGQTVMAVAGLLSGGVSAKSIGGPIMMYQLTAKSVEQGMDTFLNLMAVISINLGVMNLLPIPILDGFHLLAAGWEAVRRRPIPVRVREVANMIGLALLIVLMVFAAYNDITRRW